MDEGVRGKSRNKGCKWMGEFRDGSSQLVGGKTGGNQEVSGEWWSCLFVT